MPRGEAPSTPAPSAPPAASDAAPAPSDAATTTRRRYLDVVGQIIPLNATTLLGFGFDWSAALSPGTDGTDEWSIGVGAGASDREYDVGEQSVHLTIGNAQLWLGYRFELSKAVSVRVRSGLLGYLTRTSYGVDSASSSGAGLVSGLDIAIKGFLLGVDTWVMGSTQVCFRIGAEG